MTDRYRKKPVVEARKFVDDPDGRIDSRIILARWIRDAGGSADVSLVDWHLYIDTLEGRMRVSDGDYVIRGVENEFYPCKPNIFEATYERVEESDA